MEEQSEFQAILDAMDRSGRLYRIHNGECNTRCPFCGDSVKNARSMHFYINMEYPHPMFCQRCGYKEGNLTIEAVEALEIAEKDVSVYARVVAKNLRTSRKRNRSMNGKTADFRLILPKPDPNDEYDMAALRYLEERVGGEPFTDQELERYKVICTGLYSVLNVNNIDELNVKQREGDRLNDDCIGFLSADESYIILRNTKKNGPRYTNYRVYGSWEGSKTFVCRSDVDILSERFHVVQTEGIIDLIQVERTFYKEERWKPNFIGIASCGSAHPAVLRLIMSHGVLSVDLDLYIDDEPKTLKDAKYFKKASPFFQTKFFTMKVWKNAFSGEKDFGVHQDKIHRVQVRV